MSNTINQVGEIAKATDLNSMFNQFKNSVNQLNVILPGSNIYVDGMKDTQKHYQVLKPNEIISLPNQQLTIKTQSILSANEVYDKLVDAAVKFNQIRKVKVNVYHAESLTKSDYTIATLQEDKCQEHYVSMLSEDISQINEPKLSAQTSDFNMFVNHTSSEMRSIISNTPDIFSITKDDNEVKYDNVTAFITLLYNAWKNDVDRTSNILSVNVYSCHTNCHSNCHGNSRSRR